MRLLLDLKVKKSSILLAVYLFSMFLPGYFSSPIMQMVSNIMMVGVGLLIDMIFEVLLGTGATWICLLLINHLYEFIYEREGS